MLYLNDHIWDFPLDEALRQLSEQRREQALRFRHELGRRTCAAAYLLLCRGLRQEYGITELPLFEYGEHGKPYIVGHPEIHFNLSHSGTVALCAISDQPVGADVETNRKISPGLVNYTMSLNEQEQINTSPNPTMQLLHFWTKKEALLKLTGEGIRNDVKNVLAEAEKYQFETIEKENYVYSIVKYK